MTLKPGTTNYVFTNNPVILELPETSGIANIGVFSSVGSTLATVYRGKVSLPAKIDVSDILEAVCEPLGFGYTSADHSGCLLTHETGSTFEARRVMISTAIFENGKVTGSNLYVVVPFNGGVSKKELRRLSNSDSDPFEARFLKTTGNFFFTARSSGNTIVMKETELCPLMFLNSQQRPFLIISEPLKGKTLRFVNLDPGVYSLDIDAIRRRFISEFGILPSVLEVDRGPRIVIERALPAKERYTLLFRNSLGAYERIEVVGNLTANPEFPDDDSDGIRRYDSTISDFINDRNRRAVNYSLSINTGPKRPDEVRLLLDMLASNEMYLCGVNSQPLRVIPSAKSVDYDYRPTAPTDFTLSLLLTDSDENLPADIFNDEFKSRLFSGQFTNHFC